MGRGTSKSGGGSRGNSTYNGFSITDAEGNKENYVVRNGNVDFADGRVVNNMAGNPLELIQKVYDQEGSTDNVIKRINNIGIAKAETLSDNAVEKIAKNASNKRADFTKWLNNQAYKRRKGVNRHRAYWSAM